jgi:predicted transcriptional regulator
MSKTITIRIDDDTYTIFKKAAEGDRRSISNFIEFATMSYISEEAFVTDEEMENILSDSDLVKSLKNGEAEIQSGKYRIVD